MPDPKLLADVRCPGGDCPWIKRDGADWLVNGYDHTGREIVVRIPATLGQEAGRNDT